MKTNKHRYSLLDLYAGCGGLSLGLEAAGMTVTWANEIWGPAAATFRAVHPDVPLVPIRSEEVLSEMLAKDSKLPRSGEVDIVIGGPPCQGFSGWNRYRHASDPRNSQVEIFAQIVIHLRPAVALMENVTGILSLDNGRAIKSLRRALRQTVTTVCSASSKQDATASHRTGGAYFCLPLGSTMQRLDSSIPFIPFPAR